MIASDSHSRNVGMDFFHSLPLPEFWESIFSFPSNSRILGIAFSHSLTVPEFWECVFSIPFPFPNFGNGIIHSRSRTPKSHSRSPLRHKRIIFGVFYNLMFWDNRVDYCSANFETDIFVRVWTLCISVKRDVSFRRDRYSELDWSLGTFKFTSPIGYTSFVTWICVETCITWEITDLGSHHPVYSICIKVGVN